MEIKKQYTPSPYAIQFLLLAYKTGYYLTNQDTFSTYAEQALNALERTDYIKLIPINKKYKLLTLTELGTNYVKQCFLERLRNGFLYHIYALLVKGDVINVTQTLQNDPSGMLSYVTSTNHNNLPKGRYVVERVDKYSVLMVNEETKELYRVKSYQARDFLKLQLPEELDIEKEMCKRFGRISVKYTSKQLGAKIKDNLQLVKIMSELYNLPAARNRIDGAI